MSHKNAQNFIYSFVGEGDIADTPSNPRIDYLACGINCEINDIVNDFILIQQIKLFELKLSCSKNFHSRRRQMY